MTPSLLLLCMLSFLKLLKGILKKVPNGMQGLLWVGTFTGLHHRHPTRCCQRRCIHLQQPTAWPAECYLCAVQFKRLPWHLCFTENHRSIFAGLSNKLNTTCIACTVLLHLVTSLQLWVLPQCQVGSWWIADICTGASHGSQLTCTFRSQKLLDVTSDMCCPLSCWLENSKTTAMGNNLANQLMCTLLCAERC